MSEIRFEEDDTNMYSSRPRPRNSMVGWLISHGIVRSEDSGEIILILLIGFNFLASFLILRYFGVI